MASLTKKSKGNNTKMSNVKVAVPRILETEVQTTHLLGEGAYGQVWKGICRSNPVAIKYVCAFCLSLSQINDIKQLRKTLKHKTSFYMCTNDSV